MVVLVSVRVTGNEWLGVNYGVVVSGGVKERTRRRVRALRAHR